jgi:hypothetical protein
VWRLIYFGFWARLIFGRFYYADERSADGRLVGRTISGEAHAKMYKELAESKTQGPWLQTFVKGKGYVNFPADTDVSFRP